MLVIAIVQSQRSFVDAATTWREGVFVDATLGSSDQFGSTSVDVPAFACADVDSTAAKESLDLERQDRTVVMFGDDVVEKKGEPGERGGGV